VGVAGRSLIEAVMRDTAAFFYTVVTAAPPRTPTNPPPLQGEEEFDARPEIVPARGSGLSLLTLNALHSVERALATSL
jgi:hypothetical protein